jgi:phosphoribosylaminoimidazole-succinocarboxamide synthase
MQKGELLYSGKAKSVYACDDADKVIIDFRNDVSAYNGDKLAKLSNKGMINNKINAFIMDYLTAEGISTHHIKMLSSHKELVHRLDMIPIECVVRNRVAGSLAKRFDMEEGTELPEPIFEFYLKDDALGDPLVNESHIHVFNWATDEDVAEMKRLSLRVNELVSPLFAQKEMLLVDYKLEFGHLDGKLCLGDELTPDGCRIWDAKTGEKMDKDRFRRDMGHVVEYYQQVAERLGVAL